MKSKTYLANLKLAELWQRAASASFRGYYSGEDFDSSSYKTGALTGRRTIVPTEFVMVDPSLLNSLSTGERKWAATIMKELKQNNALWYCDYRKKGRIEVVISALRSRNLLFKTDDVCMHLVNPWLMRRGTVPATIVATDLLLGKIGNLDKEMVKDLKRPPAATIKAYYSLQT